MKIPKQIRQNYVINLLGLLLLFGLLYTAFETGIFGARTNYFKGIATTACYTIIMVTSLNLLVGIMGEFSLGHAGFMSVGAYASAVLTNAVADQGIPPFVLFALALLVGGLAAAATGVLVGIPTLKLRGDYLAIVTVAFAEIIRVAFTNFSITGGGRTMSGITMLSDFYWVFWVTVLCVTIMLLFIRSRFGRTVKAIREDYIAAAASGVNVTFYKVMTFTISAFFAGIAGAIYAHYMTAMIPTSFNFMYSAEFLTEVIIGGTGSMTGSVIGAAFLSALPEAMRTFAKYRMLAYSVVLVLIMIFKPGGIFGTWEFSLSRIVRRLTGRNQTMQRPPAGETVQTGQTAAGETAQAGETVQTGQTAAGETAQAGETVQSGQTAAGETVQPQAEKTDQIPVLRASHLGIQFGGLKAVDDFNLEIGQSELVGLIGPNGAGKTTVFNLLTGVYQPTEGAYYLNGEKMNGKKTYQVVDAGIARTFQNIRLFKKLSVLDNVKVAMNKNRKYTMLSAVFRSRSYWEEEEQMNQNALELLKIVHLEQKADYIAENLPYGEQRRLEIARALATGMKLLLLDEPAAGMNPTETAELLDIINHIRSVFGISVLLIEHDMSLVMAICERIQVIDYGMTIAAGLPEEIAGNPKVIEAYLGKQEEGVC